MRAVPPLAGRSTSPDPPPEGSCATFSGAWCMQPPPGASSETAQLPAQACGTRVANSVRLPLWVAAIPPPTRLQCAVLWHQMPLWPCRAVRLVRGSRRRGHVTGACRPRSTCFQPCWPGRPWSPLVAALAPLAPVRAPTSVGVGRAAHSAAGRHARGPAKSPSGGAVLQGHQVRATKL